MKTNPKNQDSLALKAAERVLAREIEGLEALKDVLGEPFEKVCETLLKIKGRVVISGMGKSGHIARKIAATMASTGTPAIFVHPGEASHGDLGMITEQDAVILLSNSGETAELSDIIHYTRRHSIPLVAIVRRKTSMLVEAADYAFVLPEIPEASPSVGAPTTSTIMMLALGDMIALALIEMKGFTPEDFNQLHPGGKLGKRFLKVKDIMRKEEALPLSKKGDKMSDVLLEITAKSLGCAGVLDAGGKLAGIITDGDLRRHMDHLLSQKAEEVMTKNPATVEPNTLAVQALDIMNRKSITALFVLDNGKPVGLIHIHDILRAGVA